MQWSLNENYGLLNSEETEINQLKVSFIIWGEGTFAESTTKKYASLSLGTAAAPKLNSDIIIKSVGGDKSVNKTIINYIQPCLKY
jgi:hypothetical protein